MWRSVRQTPQAWTSSATWPGPGSGAGTSAGRSGSPRRSSTIARMVGEYAPPMVDTLVTTDWLGEHVRDPGVRVVDCRFRLGEPGAGEALWREGHIPGAVFL